MCGDGARGVSGHKHLKCMLAKQWTQAHDMMCSNDARGVGGQ